MQLALLIGGEVKYFIIGRIVRWIWFRIDTKEKRDKVKNDIKMIWKKFWSIYWILVLISVVTFVIIAILNTLIK